MNKRKKLPIGIESSRPVGKGKSFYPSTPVWKIFKYEYASDIF